MDPTGIPSLNTTSRDTLVGFAVCNKTVAILLVQEVDLVGGKESLINIIKAPTVSTNKGPLSWRMTANLQPSRSQLMGSCEPTHSLQPANAAHPCESSSVAAVHLGLKAIHLFSIASTNPSIHTSYDMPENTLALQNYYTSKTHKPQPEVNQASVSMSPS